MREKQFFLTLNNKQIAYICNIWKRRYTLAFANSWQIRYMNDPFKYWVKILDFGQLSLSLICSTEKQSLPPFTLDLLWFDFSPSLIILIHWEWLRVLQSTPDFINFQIQWNHYILHLVQRRLLVSLSLVRISHKFQFSSDQEDPRRDVFSLKLWWFNLNSASTMDECEDGAEEELMAGLRKEHFRWVEASCCSIVTTLSFTYLSSEFSELSLNTKKVVLLKILIILIMMNNPSQKIWSFWPTRSNLLKILPILSMILVVATILITTVVLEQVIMTMVELMTTVICR